MCSKNLAVARSQSIYSDGIWYLPNACGATRATAAVVIAGSKIIPPLDSSFDRSLESQTVKKNLAER